MHELMSLLQESAKIEREMLAHPWVNNRNNPIAEISEYLTAEVMGGERAINNTKGFDVLSPDGDKIEVKCRRLEEDFPRGSIFGVLREPHEFDYVAFLVFNMDYSIRAFVLLPKSELSHVSRFSKRQAGWVSSVYQVLECGSHATHLAKAKLIWEGRRESP